MWSKDRFLKTFVAAVALALALTASVAFFSRSTGAQPRAGSVAPALGYAAAGQVLRVRHRRGCHCRRKYDNCIRNGKSERACLRRLRNCEARCGM
ncbi:MAG TPA: hypothetical protein VFA21_06180 [Pyrinomonadaceae bacterium]|nr:hypothetical protein [Pyrinomonadaceae bacterium]